MTANAYVGGIRDRLVHDSMWHRVNDGLQSIGWFNSGRDHAPVTVVPDQLNWDEEILPNTISITPGGLSPQDGEIGSNMIKATQIFYADLWAENEAIGLQLSGDIRDLIQGKFASLGQLGPELDVYDYTMATPPQIFVCEIENVTRIRAQGFQHRWQRYWYIVTCEVIDYYTDDAHPDIMLPGT